MNAPAKPYRLDYLDAVRAFALLLGIVFHASLSFLPFFIGWAVMDISTSSLVSSFMLISHSFRMELFFLIAGFFSHMTFNKKGAMSFISSRLLRIAVPFLVGWFILKPLIVSGWVMGSESMGGDVNIVNGLKAGLQTTFHTPNEFLTGSHLWFLYYLLLITTLMLAVRWTLSLNKGLYERVTKWTDNVVSFFAHSRLSWLVLSLPTSICLWNMSNWGMDTPDRSLTPHLPVLLVYSGCFGLGWLIHRQQNLLALFTRLSASRFAISSLSIGTTLILSAYQGDTGHPNLTLIHTAFVFSYSVMMWSLVFLTIGLFKRFFDRPSKTVRYLADSSYWLYLIHLPIVIWLQIAFAELSLHWSLKLFGISVLTIIISLICYDCFVRSTFIGNVLNGQRKSRVLFKTRKQIVALSQTSQNET